FSFYYSGSLSYLHSFPTRRSSDLVKHDLRAAADADRGNAIAVVAEIAHFFADAEALLPAAIVRVLVDADLAPATAAALVLVLALDRKSTRLNSSHLGISYAVFCLK